MASAQPRWRSAVSRTWDRLLDGDRRAEVPILVLLVLACAALTWASVAAPDYMSPSALGLVIVVGGFLLSIRDQLWLFAAVTVCMIVDAILRHPYGLRPGSVATVVLTGAVVLAMSRVRTRLGVRGTRGDSVLLDIAEHSRTLGRLPRALPGWSFDPALTPVGERLFSGDLLLSVLRPGPDPAGAGTLEVLLVDVSGKGRKAAARSLHLSGALGCLLGTVEPPRLLPAANAYLMRLAWDDDLATAVHLVLDLDTGDFEVFNAGHLPAVRHHPGSPTWQRFDAVGPPLGVTEGVTYEPQPGRLAPGDTLLLFTDGLIEVPGEDIDDGLTRLLTLAEPVVSPPVRGTASALLHALADGSGDDRALVVIHRRVDGRAV